MNMDYIDWSNLENSKRLVEGMNAQDPVRKAYEEIQRLSNLLLSAIERAIDDPKHLSLTQRLKGNAIRFHNWRKDKEGTDVNRQDTSGKNVLNTPFGQAAMGGYNLWKKRYGESLVETLAEKLLVLEDWQGIQGAVEELKSQLLNFVARVGDTPMPTQDVPKQEMPVPSQDYSFTADTGLAPGAMYSTDTDQKTREHPWELSNPEFISKVIDKLKNSDLSNLNRAFDDNDVKGIVKELSNLYPDFDWNFAAQSPELITNIANKILSSSSSPQQQQPTATAARKETEPKENFATQEVMDYIRKVDLSHSEATDALMQILRKVIVGTRSVDSPKLSQSIRRGNSPEKRKLLNMVRGWTNKIDLLTAARKLAERFGSREDQRAVQDTLNLVRSPMLDSVLEKWESGWTDEQIAAELGYDVVKSFQKWRQRLNKDNPNLFSKREESFTNYASAPHFSAAKITRLLGE